MAEKLRKDKSYILRLINAIEEDDLIKRVVNPVDRRKNILVVTEKGLLLLDRFLTIENELLKDLQQGISQDEIDIFYKVIDQIQHNAEQA
jgi:MarR family transcriptional regulator for hemolysin